MKRLKNVVKIMLIMVLMIPLFVINVNAEDDYVTNNHIRTFRYVRNNEVIYVKSEIEGNVVKTDPIVENSSGTVIGTVDLSESSGNYKYSLGAAPYLYKHGSIYLYSDKDKKLNSFTSFFSGVEKEPYMFNGALSSGSADILKEGAYNDDYHNTGVLSKDQLNNAKNSGIECNYIVGRQNIDITMYASSGNINVYPNNTEIENPTVFLQSLEKGRICPVTICYKKSSTKSYSDSIYFSTDKEYSCPSGYEKNNQRNQDKLSSDVVDAYITEEQRAVYEKQINAIYSGSVTKALQCLYSKVDTDSPKRCPLKYMVYETKCKNGTSSDECKQAMADYINCVKKEHPNKAQTECSVLLNQMDSDFKNLPKDALNDYVLNGKVAIAVGDLEKEYSAEYVPCDELLGNNLIDFLSEIYFYIEVVAVLLVIIFGLVDFMKAASLEDADANKKAFKSFIRRLIALIVLILLPFILEFLLGIFEMGGIESDNPLCKVVK